MYIDTHSHLNFKAFDNDWKEAILHANENNVGAIINVGSNLKTSKKAIEIAEKTDNVFAAIGLHPIHVKDEAWPEADFEKLVKHKKVVAIGETGLDYYYDKGSIDLQREIFEKSLSLATNNSKPVIFHSRDASEDILSILMSQKILPKGVIHCFQGNWQMAQALLDMGLLISFTGLITFSKNQETFEVIEKMPLDRIMIETDCPYMTPDPYRGKRNEPAYIIEVAKKIAKIKKIPLEKVEAQTTKNAIELFKLDLN